MIEHTQLGILSNDFAVWLPFRDTLQRHLAGSRFEIVPEPRSRAVLGGFPQALIGFPSENPRWDAVIWLVSASKGVTALARQWVGTAWAAGLPPVVYLDTENADADLIELAEMEIRETLAACGHPADDLPIVRGPQGIWAVELIAVLQTIPQPTLWTESPLRFIVDEVFHILGQGLVATGTIAQGAVRVGDEVDILRRGSSCRATVSGIETWRQPLTFPPPPDRGLLFAGLQTDQLERGDLLVAPDTIRPCERFDASLICFHGERVRATAVGDAVDLNLRGFAAPVRVQRIETPLGEPLDRISPGVPVRVSLRSEWPLPVETGTRFGVAERMSGVGRVIQTDAEP